MKLATDPAVAAMNNTGEDPEPDTDEHRMLSEQPSKKPEPRARQEQDDSATEDSQDDAIEQEASKADTPARFAGRVLECLSHVEDSIPTQDGLISHVLKAHPQLAPITYNFLLNEHDRDIHVEPGISGTQHVEPYFQFLQAQTKDELYRTTADEQVHGTQDTPVRHGTSSQSRSPADTHAESLSKEDDKALMEVAGEGHALYNYFLGLMLLEQQKEKRRILKQQEENWHSLRLLNQEEQFDWVDSTRRSRTSEKLRA